MLAALALALIATASATAQLSGTVPPASHQVAVELLYSGDYRRAERGFTSDGRSAIKIGQSRWIDSIASHAMLGETYYQQGRSAEALAQFDQACSLFLAYPDWLRQVNFQQPPRAENSPARRQAPWGRTTRQVAYGVLTDTQLISRGRIDNSLQAETGGVVQAAQFWKVDVVEIVRCTALAIRRRNELLGPLGPTDRLSKELVDTLGRGTLAPSGHWSNAWIELLLGVAQMGTADDVQAVAHLNRAVLLDGRLDHDLTGFALLAQADIARRTGAAQAAATLYAEAGLAGFAYEDLDVLTEALTRGAMHHASSGAPGVYPPLENALGWAQREGFDHTAWLLGNSLAEGLTANGATDQAAAILNAGSRRQRDLANGRPGVTRDWLAALVLVQQGSDEALETLAGAMQRQAAVSLSNFQTGLANARFDTGALSPRLAVDVYKTLLSDPTPQDWLDDTFDAITHLKTDHEGALDRWFAASIGRNETLEALEISDLAKRRRFFRAQPLAGRLVAMRRLLESPLDQLGKQERLERQALLAAYPQYVEVSAQMAAARQQLAAMNHAFEDGKPTQQADRLLDDWYDVSQSGERLLAAMALSRRPSTLGFPPARTAKETQELLEEGDALVVFHSSGGAMHGFLVVNSAHHYWRLPVDGRRLTAAVAETLRQLGNYGPGRSLPAEEAESAEWRDAVLELGKLVLGESRLDLATAGRVVIVPDGPLWHAPFEALLLEDKETAPTIIEAAPVRYAPTFGSAVGDLRPVRPVRQTGLAFARPSGDAAERETTEYLQGRLEEAAEPSVRISAPTAVASPLLSAAFEQLVVDYDEVIDLDSPYDWSPTPLDRSNKRGRLAAWLALPVDCPESLILTRTHTLAESGLKTGRRASASLVPGDELFHAACGLLASGPRTVLLSRWTTGGAVHAELVREMVGQLERVPAAEAWRRSVTLARASYLDPLMEPRLAWSDSDGDPPTAEHPFFWAGYLLLDTGVDPTPDPPEEEGPEEAAPKEAAAKPPAEPAE